MNARLQGIGMTSQRTRERLASRLRDEGITNEDVLNAMRSTPRHIFVDEALATRAYEDTALPIGHGQTISQPYIVARMTEALIKDGKLEKVLEIGTGSGYQTAILAQLVEKLYSVERIQSLQIRARARLRELKITNVKFKYDDGVMGWKENAPFDGIIVTAAPVQVPDQLLLQLAVGGKMIIPTGSSGQQVLRLIHRTNESFEEEYLAGVEFVPLVDGVT